MRTIKAIVLFAMIVHGMNVKAQTLQQVTDNGSTTSNGISVALATANAPSFAGASTPTHINFLNGYRINGSIGDASHNGITYQSGGGGGAAIGFFRGGSYDTGIDFYTNYSGSYGDLQHRMRIASNGNVGIGTANPGNKLAVLMDAWTNGDGIAVQAVNGTGLGSQPGYALLNSSGNKRMYSYLDVFTDTYNIGNASGINLMTLNQNGNVGIGTSLPNSKLAVNGNIRAHEIKVETANWPDYVFAKEYQLPTLLETEKHVKEKGHLQGIPSAAEVKANGIDLGEMNAKLLQKIEELTLHLIEKDKQLTEDRKLILNQEERLKKLEGKIGNEK